VHHGIELIFNCLSVIECYANQTSADVSKQTDPPSSQLDMLYRLRHPMRPGSIRYRTPNALPMV
jgi:hypothetical protein